MSDIKQRVLEELKKVQDPDLNQDIVSAGFVKKMDFQDGKLEIFLELTTPACPIKEQFRQQIKDLTMALKEVESVEVHMGARPRAAIKENQQKSLKLVDTLLAVASCKGGVGKSTIAALVACELGARGYRVGILDLDIFGPSLPTLFSMEGERVLMKNQMLEPRQKKIKFGDSFFTISVMSFGFLMGDAPAVMRGAIVSNYMNQILNQVDWGELDYLIFDLPPGTGDTQLTLAQSAQIDGSLIVTTQASLSFADVARGVKMFEKVKVPLYGIVDNMSYFICDQCDKKHFIFQNKEKDVKKCLGLDVLAKLPIIKEGTLDFSHYHSRQEVKDFVDNLVRKIGSFKQLTRESVEVKKEEKSTSFIFNQKEVFTFSNKDLRYLCPCALCCDEFTGERKVRLADIRDDVHVKEASPLGNYAISIRWSDEHSSGIYSYHYLRQLADQLVKKQ